MDCGCILGFRAQYYLRGLGDLVTTGFRFRLMGLEFEAGELGNLKV